MESRSRSAAGREAVAINKAASKSISELANVVASLSTGFDSIRTAFNKNHLAYAQAIGAVDGHISVMRAVINDIQRGDVQLDEEGNVNWEIYYGWYNEHLKQELAQQDSEQSDTPKVEEAEIFGGDYGSGVRQVLESESAEASEGNR